MRDGLVARTPSLDAPEGPLLRPKGPQLTVAHFRTPFLALSETFIYAYLNNFRQTRPIVFTSQRLHEQSFPFHSIEDFSFKKLSWDWLLNGIENRVWGYNTKNITRRLMKRGVDLIHAHFGPEGFGLLDVKRRTGLPLITNFYGYDLSYLGRDERWLRNYSQLFDIGEMFLVEGPHMAGELIRIGCPAEKIGIQRIGVDFEKFPPVIPSRNPGNIVRILFCGRFVEKKGLIYALRACARLLASKVENFEFRVIGDGELMPEMKTFISSQHLQDHVNLLGLKTHAEFYRELEEADIFIAPSTTAASGDTEGGAPTTILEAEAFGLPVVATRHADIPYVTVEGETALLVGEGDVGGLEDALKSLIEKPALRTKLGNAGRRHVEKYHGIRKLVEDLESLYERIHLKVRTHEAAVLG